MPTRQWLRWLERIGQRAAIIPTSSKSMPPVQPGDHLGLISQEPGLHPEQQEDRDADGHDPGYRAQQPADHPVVAVVVRAGALIVLRRERLGVGQGKQQNSAG